MAATAAAVAPTEIVFRPGKPPARLEGKHNAQAEARAHTMGGCQRCHSPGPSRLAERPSPASEPANWPAGRGKLDHLFARTLAGRLTFVPATHAACFCPPAALPTAVIWRAGQSKAERVDKRPFDAATSRREPQRSRPVRAHCWQARASSPGDNGGGAKTSAELEGRTNGSGIALCATQVCAIPVEPRKLVAVGGRQLERRARARARASRELA